MGKLADPYQDFANKQIDVFMNGLLNILEKGCTCDCSKDVNKLVTNFVKEFVAERGQIGIKDNNK